MIHLLWDTVDPTGGIIDWIRTTGLVGGLTLAVIAFVKGWIVPGPTYRQALTERDRALELVYRNADIAQRALAAAERASGEAK